MSKAMQLAMNRELAGRLRRLANELEDGSTATVGRTRIGPGGQMLIPIRVGEREVELRESLRVVPNSCTCGRGGVDCVEHGALEAHG